MDSSKLPRHRRQAMSEYRILVEDHPDLFRPREQRTLILDSDELADFASSDWMRRGDSAVVLGLAARTPWHLFVTDLIRLPNGDVATYDRIIPTSLLSGSHGAAVVAVATADDGELGLVLVEQERHATGDRHWEIPRGFGEDSLTPEELALEELEEEAGFTGSVIKRLATMHTNSGQTAERVDYLLIEARPLSEARPEDSEAILDSRVWSREDLWRAVENGFITDAFTLNGLALWERYLAMESGSE